MLFRRSPMSDDEGVGGAAGQFLIDQTRTQVTDQIARLESYRNRAFAALAVSGTVAAFLGAHLTAASANLRHLEIWSFLITVVLAVALVFPWRFSQGIGPKTYYDWVRTDSGTDAEKTDGLIASTARDVVGSWVNNERRLGWVTGIFTVQCAALGVQVLLLILKAAR